MAGDCRISSSSEWRERCQNLEKSNSQLKRNNAFLESRVEVLEREMRTTAAENDELAGELRHAEAALWRSKSETEKYSNSINFITTNLQERAESAENQLMVKIKECNEYLYKDSSSEVERRIAEADQKTAEAESKVEKYLAEIASFRLRIDGLTRSKCEAEEKIAVMGKIIDSKDRDIQLLMERHKLTSTDISEKLNKLKKLEDDKKCMSKAIKRLKIVAHSRGERLRAAKVAEQKKIEEEKADNQCNGDGSRNVIQVIHDSGNAKMKVDIIKEQNETIKNLKKCLQDNWRILEQRNAENRALETTIKELKLEVQHENVTIFNLVKKLEHLMSRVKKTESESSLHLHVNQGKHSFDDTCANNANKINENNVERPSKHFGTEEQAGREYGNRLTDQSSVLTDLRTSLVIKDQVISRLNKQIRILTSSIEDKSGAPLTNHC